VLKDRIQEIFEFTKSESPYRKANKGWINQDIFLDLSPVPDTFAQKNEAAKITVWWSPVNTLLSNIFIVIIISSLMVFTSLSFAKGRFNLNLFNTSLTNEIIQAKDNNVMKTNQLTDLDSLDLENEQNLEIEELETKNNMISLDDNQIKSDQKTITTEIDKKEVLIKDKENNTDIRILENKKSKSNFI
tara:strand:- start:83 stop:646 length:564 start_codon:yes stop_codon:yes gene_type:complete